MSHDVIIGTDGRPRCAWAGDSDTPLGRYHDEVWAHRPYDQHAMFEALTLGVFEVGLSWSSVLNKRDAFRAAFHDFDIAKVAAMTDKDVGRLTQDASIIRNRGKIQATVDNARAMLSASPSLAELAKSYESTRQRSPDPSPPCRHPPRKRKRSPASSRRRDTDSSAPPACTRSCRTSAWSTTTSTDASAPATSLAARLRQPRDTRDKGRNNGILDF